MSSTHGFEMRLTKQKVSFEKPVNFIQFFHENASTLNYSIRVKFDYILMVNLKDSSRFVKCNLYLVYASR